MQIGTKNVAIKHGPNAVPPTEVKKFALIGPGFMGASVGYVSARAGIQVVLITLHQESADKARAFTDSGFDDLIQRGPVSENDRNETLSRIVFTTDDPARLHQPMKAARPAYPLSSRSSRRSRAAHLLRTFP